MCFSLSYAAAAVVYMKIYNKYIYKYMSERVYVHRKTQNYLIIYARYVYYFRKHG